MGRNEVYYKIFKGRGKTETGKPLKPITCLGAVVTPSPLFYYLTEPWIDTGGIALERSVGGGKTRIG